MVEEKINIDVKDVLVSDFANVTYNRILKLGKIEWIGKANSEEYQSAFLSLLEVQKRNPIQYFLTDIRNQSVVSPDNRKWFENVALPLAIKQGLKKAAVIMDGSVFKKYYANMVIKSTKKFGLPVKVLKSEEEALEWFTK